MELLPFSGICMDAAQFVSGSNTPRKHRSQTGKHLQLSPTMHAWIDLGRRCGSPTVGRVPGDKNRMRGRIQIKTYNYNQQKNILPTL